jgi:hypothetical protein
MPTFERKVMCDECPFRAKALPGWLGPHSIADIEKVVQSDESFICHEEIEEMTVRGFTDAEILAEGQHCVGMLRYRNNMCKRSRDPEVSAVQTELQSVPDEPVIPMMKFREHHEKTISKEGVVMKPVKSGGIVKHKKPKRKSD